MVEFADPFLSEYLEEGQIIDRVEITDKIVGVFMRAKQEEFSMINYLKRLICLDREKGEIVFTVNLEKSILGTCCIGAHSEDCHYNFGPAKEDMSFEEFKERAMEIARKLIKDTFQRD